MPDPSWISSFPALGSGYPNADLRNGSPVGSERLLPSQQVSPRARSHSHSSFGSEDTTASGLPAEYKSRTTAATKAAAAKRRKEGVAARYVCDMCGETFTRRYNLRGHQRAHKGEKPFECGFPGCTSRFARAHDQKRHYKLHLGVKDYNCKACGKAFIRLDVCIFFLFF
ncbi:hypothetical protein BY996DRAFT_4580704 [Phakopsora pachyrhizi]|uniref:Expressed protein n=1 Tax=Phakopsora pachyrhizi TaxID=170000 RepID=A0AAV0AT19_PHAPC|nr:hypothetical protein BY996DRAFT_4580704 [Phakopsora pachyrhizi]CAH7670768.1 expressed protein [Phakopsora pachyrhizi]